jgi:hypothetical protein
MLVVVPKIVKRELRIRSFVDRCDFGFWILDFGLTAHSAHIPYYHLTVGLGSRLRQRQRRKRGSRRRCQRPEAPPTK